MVDQSRSGVVGSATTPYSVVSSQTASLVKSTSEQTQGRDEWDNRVSGMLSGVAEEKRGLWYVLRVAHARAWQQRPRPVTWKELAGGSPLAPSNGMLEAPTWAQGAKGAVRLGGSWNGDRPPKARRQPPVPGFAWALELESRRAHHRLGGTGRRNTAGHLLRQVRGRSHVLLGAAVLKHVESHATEWVLFLFPQNSATARRNRFKRMGHPKTKDNKTVGSAVEPESDAPSVRPIPLPSRLTTFRLIFVAVAADGQGRSSEAGIS